MSLILRSRLGKSAGVLGRAPWQAFRFPIPLVEDVLEVYKNHCLQVRFAHERNVSFIFPIIHGMLFILFDWLVAKVTTV